VADLGDVLGTLLISLAHARLQADEQSAAIAEHYRDHPLLQGMSVPRVRVPELVIDLPMLLEAHTEGAPGTLADAAEISRLLRAEVEISAQRHGVALPRDLIDRFQAELDRELQTIRDLPQTRRAAPPAVSAESVARGAQSAFSRVAARPEFRDALAGEAGRVILDDLQRKAAVVAVAEPGRTPSLRASVLTAEIKDRATPDTVARVRIVLREEGLEWQTSRAADGTTRRSLGPE
jgi:hypothetical protein